jgi:hypothetical protein
MTDYSIIYMVLIVSIVVSTAIAALIYVVDRRADHNDKHS